MELSTIPALASRRTKYLGINLSKEAADLYTVDYKTLLEEIKEDPKKWKPSCDHRLEELILPKTLPELIMVHHNPYQNYGNYENARDPAWLKQSLK
jgi:hypothetical protein